MNNPNHFNLIYRLSQALSSSLDLDDVLDKVMDEVVTATHAERGFIMLTEQASGESGVRRTFYATRGLDHKEIEAPGFLTSRSVVEQVEREGEPMLTSDAQRDARLASRQSVVLLKLRSILCVPIRTQQRGLGVIYVDSRVMTGIFTQAELELLTTIASHAAVTIENARLFRETQNQLQILRTIYEIAADLTSTLDMQRVLEACLQRVMKLLSAHAASILTIEGEELVFRVALGEKSAEIKPFRIPRGEGIAGWVVEHKQGAMVNDARADNRFRSTTDQETGFVTECLLAAPLMVNERSIGVIEVFNKPGGFQQSDLDMLSAVASSASIAIENARLYQAAVEKGRMERELQVARNVQESLLPIETPHIPGWDFAAHWQPAREVGGDYYDFIPMGEQRSGIVIADVTDKGMGAALFMAFTRSVVRASLDAAQLPANGIMRANRLICTDSSYGLFVSLFYALLDPANHQVTYVNAGHNPPLFFQRHSGQMMQLAVTGMPLGVDVNTPYAQQTISLLSGDLLVLYTDGITEATDIQEKLFGMQRLEMVLREHSHLPAHDLLHTIEHAVAEFTASAPISDDRTIVVIKRV